MLERGDYRQVRDLLLEAVRPVGTERVPLAEAAGRVLAHAVQAQADIPPFDRSPYDGFAFRAEDVADAGEDHPVTLRIVDYIAAGDVPHVKITPGTAAHLMTGAPVPEGADAVLPFEKTVFFTPEPCIEAPQTSSGSNPQNRLRDFASGVSAPKRFDMLGSVSIFAPVRPGSNVVRAGEDVKKGAELCGAGVRIDAGLAGTLAGQGIFAPSVRRFPLVGIISTGTELLEEGEAPAPGRIYNTNRYALQAACALAGCQSVYIGTARDDEDEICRLIQKALSAPAAEETAPGYGCDIVLLSGGVSVGDFDCTPAAMEKAGVRLLAHGVSLKPGMAGAYGIRPVDSPEAGDGGKADQEDVRDGRPEGGPASGGRDGLSGIPVLGLSGNPAACMTAFYAVVLPVLKKRMGLAEVLPDTVRVRLSREYSRKNQSARLLRGRIEPGAVVQEMIIPERQGNQMLASLAGANAFAEIPAGGTLRAGETAEAFLL